MAINPLNPTELVSVWTRSDPKITGDTMVIAEGAYSTDGGITWNPFTAEPTTLPDPQTSNPVKNFAEVTDASVAFDRNNHFYILTSQHATNNQTGAVVLDQFDISGGSPTRKNETTVYQWDQRSPALQPAVLNPVLAVDSTVRNYSEPGWSVTNPNVNNVYVAWGIDRPPPANPPTNFNRYSVDFRYSTDGGITFTDMGNVGAGNISTEHDAAPQLAVSQGTANGTIKPGQVTIVWDDFGTDNNLTTPLDVIWSRPFLPSTGTFGGAARQVATTPIRGTITVGQYPTNYPLQPAVSPSRGIGPAPVIAADDTLGPFSPFEGRLYIAYVGRSLGVTINGNPVNPSDNTDIFLVSSSDGGATWSPSIKVNQDNAQTDGFSEANDGISGRPQFEPSVAVDQSTGTLVVSYLDARNDAARARYATYLATSIDGGQSFGPDTFANTPQTAFDVITQQDVTYGPLPDNQSVGNPNRETRYAFGDRQGLAVSNGRVYPIWSGNDNGGPDTNERLDIHVAPMRIAAGPRIISSTMGVATPVTAPLGTVINTPDPVTGVPRVTGFLVTFDRYVDPGTFTAAAVQVSYLAPGAASGVIETLSNVQVTGQDATSFGAKTFLVTFSPLTGVGTYSYAIGPNISDRIRSQTTPGNTLSGHQMDQDASGDAGQSIVDVYTAPRQLPPATTLFQSPYDTTTLPLIIPGPHIISTAALDASGKPIPQTSGENLALNQIVTGVQVTFDRDMRTSTFDGSDILSLVGPIGSIAGPFTVAPVGGSLRTFNILFPTPQRLSGTYTVTVGPNIESVIDTDPTVPGGDLVDANQNAALDQLRGGNPNGPTTTFTASNTTALAISPGQTISSTINVGTDFTISKVNLTLDINFPTDSALSATLYIPDPNGNKANDISIPLFAGVGSSGSNFLNTIFDDNATTPIENGGAPFSSRYRPQTSLKGLLSVLNGRSAKGTYILQITDSSKTATDRGQLVNWSLDFGRPLPQNGLGEPGADQTPVNFRIFVMDPNNTQSQNTWTGVGPASLGSGSGPNSAAGRIGGLAVDPSDPSGNTVYAGGASGGVWKTTNFLITDPNGPNWIPLTDFGPTNAINIGSIAVFPRNNDPRQTIIFAATGEGDGLGTGHSSIGVGLLRSMDGGATWTLLDSLSNFEPNGVTPLPINGPSPTSGRVRDHMLVGTSSYKVIVDPRLTPTGDVIVYAALSGPTGGIYRSFDTGRTWQLMKAGQATDVVLDPNSGPKDAFGNPVGNLQVLYASFGNDGANSGVYISNNQGQVFNPTAGPQKAPVGLPFIQDANLINPKPVPVNNLAGQPTPNGAGKGRIVLAKPDLFPNTEPFSDVKNKLYEGWLYALVVKPDDTLDGLYLTKDYGANWTKIAITNAVNQTGPAAAAVPSNDPTKGQLQLTGTIAPQGNYDIAISIDPSNPNIVYVGGKSDQDILPRLIRVDVSTLSDLYSFQMGNNNPTDNGVTGAVRGSTTDPSTVKNAAKPPDVAFFSFNDIGDPIHNPYTNLLANPFDPLGSPSTFYVENTASFNNSGANARWIPFDGMLGGSDDLHRIITLRDPLTGMTRLIIGDDHGIWTGVDNNGTLLRTIGSTTGGQTPIVTDSRNGNIQITQFYSGAAQPSSLAAQVAGALLYGQAQDDGSPDSNSDVLTTGNLRWGNSADLSAPSNTIGGDGSGTATDQTGTGTVYEYRWPGTGGNITDFFQVNGVGRTNGLIQQNGTGLVPDPQWPYLSPGYTVAGIAMGNFAVNPINGDQIIISSNAGRIFATSDQGQHWLSIGEPQFLDSTYAPALAYGAPDPNDPTGATNKFLYAGTIGGHIFVTFSGGGSPTTNNWIGITNGDLAADMTSNPTSILRIIPSPIRGSREAYAVTPNGIYHIADSNPNSTVPAALKTWTRITGNLLAVLQNPFNNTSLGTDTVARFLTSLAVDWRYVIPDTNPITGDPSPTHPILYAAGNSGVFRSLDDGQTWTLFPSTDAGLESAPRAGGYLPVAKVMDLSLSIGNVNPTTGASVTTTTSGANFLLASTYGRGSFTIRLAPVVLPGSVKLDSKSMSGTDPQGNPIVKTIQPVFDGLSQQSAFGNITRISIFDLTDPSNPRLIGGFDPSNPATDIAANRTDSSGTFAVQVSPSMFPTSGIKKIGIQASDLAGAKGNIQTITINLQASNSGGSHKPTMPTLLLNPSDDSSQGQRITNVYTGHVIGVTDPNTTVSLFSVVGGVISGSPLGTPAVSDANGNYILMYPPLADGSYTFLVQASNSVGTTNSAPLTITIDTQGPTSAPTLGLDPNSDTGVKGDGITSTPDPTLVGTADPNVFVDIFDPNNTVVAGAKTDASGHYSVTFPVSSSGSFVLTARARDVAHNLGPASTSFTLQIITSAAAPSAPTLQPGSDTGPVGDNITSARSPVFNIAGVPAGATLTLFRNGVMIVTVPNVAGGTVALADPGTLLDGRYTYAAQLTDVAGNVSPVSAATVVSIVTVKGDYNGDGKADLAVFRRVSASEAAWFVDGVVPPGSPAFGSGTLDVPFQGDLDGDGKTDLILYRPSTSTWYAQQSSAGFAQYKFGAVGDLPAVGDFDGVGHDELAVYRPSTGQWFVAGHATVFATFGGPGDVPVPLKNYYGTGQDALAVFRPGTGQWFVAGQGAGITFGGDNNLDVPIPLYNYDGLNHDVLATFRPSTSQWFVAGLASGITFGGSGDVPIAGDFDGVGYSELGVFRPSTTEWFVAGHGTAIKTFGSSVDIPLSSAYAYRALSGSTGSVSTVSSLGALDLGVNAMVLATGSTSSSTLTSSPVVATPSLASTSTRPATKAKTLGAPSTTQQGRPNQLAKSSNGHLHDHALASLNGIHKRARGSLIP